MSLGSAPQNANSKWNPDKPCIDRYTKGMESDGTFIMLSELKKNGIIDELLVFYESNRGPGYANWGRGVFGWVCPQISFVNKFIDKNTIIYVRGGFRGWFGFLTARKDSNWLMCYNANTGRERWTFWDIILWDLQDNTHIDRYGRLWYHYKKPIDQQTFRQINQRLYYDVCIGASHIHDKKGQWRVIDALLAYREKYGVNLRAVLPGFGKRGTQTSQIDGKIITHGLNVTRTGMVDRADLSRNVYNRSKIAMFLGTHGQGDRGPIEALACGVPIMIGSKRYHSPEVYHENVAVVPKNINDRAEIVDLMHDFLTHTPDRSAVRQHFKDTMDFYEVCFPNLSMIFEFIRENPKPSLEAKRRLIESCT